MLMYTMKPMVIGTAHPKAMKSESFQSNLASGFKAFESDDALHSVL